MQLDIPERICPTSATPSGTAGEGGSSELILHASPEKICRDPSKITLNEVCLVDGTAKEYVEGEKMMTSFAVAAITRQCNPPGLVEAVLPLLGDIWQKPPHGFMYGCREGLLPGRGAIQQLTLHDGSKVFVHGYFFLCTKTPMKEQLMQPEEEVKPAPSP